MILVDSCVWIDFLKGKRTKAVSQLELIKQARTPEICISSIIFFEVLRGIPSDLERTKVKKSFELFEQRNFHHSGFSELVELTFKARRQGLTLSKLGDWLIIKTVLDHSLTLLTSDQDFFRISKVIPLPLLP